MSLRLVICGLIFTTALVRGQVAYQISHRPVSGPTLVAQTPVTGPLMVGYLVAGRPVPAGTLTRPEDFTAKIVPSSEVPPVAIVDTPDVRATVRGALMRHYVDPGMPLLQSDLMRPRDRGFLAAVLAPGMRAVSTGVDPVSGVAGLIWPGDRVDVILTQDITQGGGRATRLITGETVLANVAVSAVDQNIAQRTLVNGTSAGTLAGTVTIQATSEEAEKLAVAQQLGHLTLAVRSLDDLRPGRSDASISDADTSVTGADVSPELARASAAVIGTRVQVVLPWRST